MELTLDQALQKGIEAHKAGQVQDADRYYTAILKANPKHPDANHNMGVLAVGVGKVEQALPFFKTALEANSSILQYWLSYIDALIKLDRMDEAKSVFEQAKSIGAKWEGFAQLEEQLKEAGQASKAKEPPQEELNALIELYDQKRLTQVYDKSRKLTKKYTESLTLWNLIGATASQIGQPDEAILAFQKVLSLKPDYVDAYNNMGVTLQEQDKLDEAIEVYKKAISFKPDFAEGYYNIGNALKKQGKLDKAVEAYKKAISLEPDFAGAHSNMGLTLQGQDRLDEAIEAYKKAISIKPDFAEAYYNMGNALQDQGKLDEAIEAFNKALSIKPDYAKACNNIGNAFKEQGKLDEAIKAYKKAISFKPDFAEAYYNIGNAFKQHRKLGEAIEAFNKALSIKPDYHEVSNNMGLTLQEQNRLDEAVEAYQNAISIKPDNAEAYNNMGNALKEQGKLEKAIEAYNKALSIKHDYAQAYNNATLLLKEYSPSSVVSHSLFITDRKLRKLSENLIISKSNAEISENILKGLSYVGEDNFLYKTPHSQIYKHNTVDLNCKRHIQIFSKKDIIPEFCFGCFKVQVEVATFIDLIKITSLFYRFDFEEDLTTKTMIELRPDISGYYKGLIFCASLDQAKAVQNLLNTQLKKIFGEDTTSNIKRGCSEYPLKFPNYGKIANCSKEMMSFPKEWKLLERQFDRDELIEPSRNTRASLNGFCLSDFYIIQKWIDYAKGIGDKSITSFNDMPIIFGDIYELAKKRVLAR